MIIKELEKIFNNALSFNILNINKANNDFENNINLLNNKFNKIEEENMNIKNILTEKYNILLQMVYIFIKIRKTIELITVMKNEE